jgi:competence protein ComEC
MMILKRSERYSGPAQYTHIEPGGRTINQFGRRHGDKSPPSVVLEVRYGEFSALLTGDIPSETMSHVLEKVDLPITVIKVPHHGSSGSLPPGFYQELHPNLAVISVGANNPFGHPTPSVLEALAQANVKVLRTDQDGLVMMRTDGQDLTVSSYKGVKGTGP